MPVPTTAAAVAPEPAPTGLMATLGVEVYPLPGLFTVMAVTTLPTNGQRCFEHF